MVSFPNYTSNYPCNVLCIYCLLLFSYITKMCQSFNQYTLKTMFHSTKLIWLFPNHFSHPLGFIELISTKSKLHHILGISARKYFPWLLLFNAKLKDFFVSKNESNEKHFFAYIPSMWRNLLLVELPAVCKYKKAEFVKAVVILIGIGPNFET